MGHHVDMKLGHGTRRTLYRADCAGVVQEVREVGDLHLGPVNYFF
jgi:hypothetical protein